MSLKRKLLGLSLLAAVAAVTVVVMSASASNREGHWATPKVAGASITGKQDLTHVMEFSVEGATGIICETSKWDTTTEAETAKFLEIVPSVANCKTTGGVANQVTIKVNGCAFDLYVAKGTVETTEQTADLLCGAVPIEIIHNFCTVTIGTQKSLTGITYKDIKPFATGVTASFNVKLAASADGGLCPKVTTAKLSGSLIFEAFSGVLVNLEVT
ncbi:MAG TPA: hypothetical protein VFJ61_10215 [Solirubrobacterales bacterium]|nr:hypothetical protein [Solirubrobacterales bacterium]